MSSPRGLVGNAVVIAGWFDAIEMILRYAVLRRDRIPVVFHIVLAGFLPVVAHYHRT